VSVVTDNAQVVRHHQDRNSRLAIESGNHVVKVFRTVEVNSGRRFVKQKQLRLGVNRQSQQHALQFTTGNLLDGLVQQRGRRFDCFDDLVDPALGLPRNAEKDRPSLEREREQIAHG